MKNNSLRLLIFLGVFSAFSCSKSELEELNGVEDASLKSTPSNWTIATHYAPQIIQDVDVTDGWCSGHSRTGSADWIAAVNYDGDWIAHNNWENMVSQGRALGNLKGYVYYNISITPTHWYILYSVYHPRDWDDFLCRIDEHENDMEGVLICASRGTDGNTLGEVEYMSSIYHSERRNYRSNEILLSGNRPIIFIQAKGHGIRRYEGSSDRDGSYIEYNYGGDVVQPLDGANDLPQDCNYGLLSLHDELYSRRNNSDLFAGASFRGDNYRENAANAPWAWGDICLRPAHYVRDAFDLSSHNTSYSHQDIN